MSHKRITTGMIAALIILAGAPGLFAQGGPAKPVERRGFYLSAQAVFWSSLEFPTAYGTYKSIGGAAVPNQMYLETTGLFSSRPGFGLTAGYEFRQKWLTFGAEIEYARATVADGPERLTDLVWQNYATTETVRTFTQSGRKVSLFDISLFFGAFPFRSFGLGFNITAGAGYGQQSFTSPSAVDALSRGMDVNNLNSVEWYDFGSYDGGGTWSRGSFIYFVGLGTEYMISRRLGIRFDYKRVVSSYTRENVLISSGVVNVYQNSKSYEYAVGNKFTAGLNYRIGS